MDTQVFGKQLNGAFFTLGDAFAIIFLVPLLEGVLLPALKRRRGRALSRRAKYTWGFIFAILANLSAAFLEYIRRGMSEGDCPNFVPCPKLKWGTSECEF